MPQKAAGMRIEPAPSVPWARGPRPAATAAAGPAEEIITQLLVTEVGRVGFAQEHGATLAQTLRDHAIRGGDMLLEELGAKGGPDAVGHFKILEGVGHAIEQADWLAAGLT